MKAFNELNEINPNTNNYYTRGEIITSVENTISEYSKQLYALKSNLGKGTIDVRVSKVSFVFPNPIMETETDRESKIETKESKIKELKEAYGIK